MAGDRKMEGVAPSRRNPWRMHLAGLLQRVERSGPDGLTDRLVAHALGWHERRVTRIGLNGRTPGQWRWFDPEGHGPKSLPRFTGPRKRTETSALLKALIASEGTLDGAIRMRRSACTAMAAIRRRRTQSARAIPAELIRKTPSHDRRPDR
jgi:hypothetical protein